MAFAFDPVSTVAKYVLVIVPWSMVFAFSLGNAYEPFVIQEAPLTRVLFESEKDRVAAVEGEVIFDLDRYLLLFTENKSGKSVAAIPHETLGDRFFGWIKLRGFVVAIPHEKIKSIQTPPLPAASPTPAVASPTPAQTSPKSTETPHVSPSPVRSPTQLQPSHRKNRDERLPNA